MTASGLQPPVAADVVVVGAGVAGMTAALELAGRRVVLLTKARLGAGGSSHWAQGGVAAALGDGDSPSRHAADTLAVAGGIADADIVGLLTREGPARVRQLIDRGARFDRSPAGDLRLGREAAHSRRRILHAGGDATGAEMVRALVAALAAAPHVRVEEGVFAQELLSVDGEVVGVLARTAEGAWRAITARAVVLASGGLGQLYRYTTNPVECTGDGVAMAARAGAVLADLELVQFHPTALAAGADPLPLLTEALRGEGALLTDGAGHRFMPAEHPLAELAPRDVVARAIWRRRAAGEAVFLDARQAMGGRFPQRFPTVWEACAAAGIDPRLEPIPVAPAAHYHMGGIAVDAWGRSSLPGLWAAGEVASTGAHGANRLASNSLLEALVFGGRVAADVAGDRRRQIPGRNAWLQARSLVQGHGEGHGTAASRWAALPPRQEREVRSRLRELAWARLGLVRDGEGLASASDRLRALQLRHGGVGGELGNLLTAARLVAAAALRRAESRGAHWRTDFPDSDPALAHRLMGTAEELLAGAGVPRQPAERPRAAGAAS